MAAARVLDYGELLAEAKPEVVHRDELYNQMLAKLSELLVMPSLNEAQEKLVELLTFLIREYEKERYKDFEKASAIEVVKFLMEQNDLKQKDLVPVIFESESVASETLNGNRDLTLKHIKRLAKRFKLSADTFIDAD